MRLSLDYTAFDICVWASHYAPAVELWKKCVQLQRELHFRQLRNNSLQYIDSMLRFLYIWCFMMDRIRFDELWVCYYLLLLRWQYSLSLFTGCIILDAQKLLELHSWRWQNHGSKCALPDVHIVALKCLFEKPLISHMHFYTIVHVWGVCFELPWFKKNAFSTFVYA